MKQILNETRMELRLDRCRLMRNSFSDVAKLNFPIGWFIIVRFFILSLNKNYEIN